MFEKCKEVVLENKIAVGIIVLGMIVGSFFFFNSSTPSSVSALPLSTEKSQSGSSDFGEEVESVASASQEEFLTVDVKGAVKNAGVYELPIGSRVHDVIKKAGGMTTEADPKSINLAQKLTDEAVIYVAAQGEEGVTVVDNQAATGTGNGSSDSKLINLNTASLEELQTISGVGQKKAQDIIDYRESSGGFKSVDDLNHVSGFGAKTVEKLKPYVTVD